MAVFVVLERDGKVFLLRRANTGWADGYFTLPSGHIDQGETVREAAIKEAREEAGVEIALEDLQFIHVDYMRDKYVNFYFKVTTWQGEPIIGEPHLASESVWVGIDELPTDTIAQLKNMFACYKQKTYFSDIENNF